MMSGYGLGYIHLMDVYMNASMLADYINVSARVGIGAGAPNALYFWLYLSFVCFQLLIGTFT